jgi:hypothetical protein
LLVITINKSLLEESWKFIRGDIEKSFLLVNLDRRESERPRDKEGETEIEI